MPLSSEGRCLPSVTPDPAGPSHCSVAPLGTRLSRSLDKCQDLPSTGSRSCIGRDIGSPAEGFCVGPQNTS